MSIRAQIETRRAAQAVEGEAGFMLVFAVVLVALVLIALAVAAPMVAKDLRRDKELESKHRGEEYVRAIRLYYRKYKSYPPSMDALENTNDVRYLRKRYIDPLTGKDDWRIIHVGQNKTTVKGFFGQALGGLNTTGIGGSTMGGGLGNAASPIGGGSSTIGSTSALSGGFLGSTIGSDGDSTSNAPAAGGSASGSAGATGASGAAGASGSGSTGDSSGSIGPIMGVGTSKTGASIINPNGQSTYESWEFIYDPKIELLYQQSSILGGGMAAQSASSLGDAASGQSNSSGGSSPSATPGSTTPGSGAGSTGTGSPTTPNSPTNSNSPF